MIANARLVYPRILVFRLVTAASLRGRKLVRIANDRAPLVAHVTAVSSFRDDGNDWNRRPPVWFLIVRPATKRLSREAAYNPFKERGTKR